MGSKSEATILTLLLFLNCMNKGIDIYISISAHISQNLPFVHSRLRWVLGQLTGLVFDFGHCRGVCWAWLYLYYLTQFAQLSIVSFFSVPFTATSFNF